MSIVVPPAPSKDAAAPVFAQLDDYSRYSTTGVSSPRDARKRVAPFVVSIVLCAAGIVLQICAITLMSAPQSNFAQFIMVVVEKFAEVCI